MTILTGLREGRLMPLLEHERHSSFISHVVGWIVLLGVVSVCLAYILMFGLPPVDKHPAVFFLGFIGLWRYSWQLTHLTRSFLYQFFVFPRLRRSLAPGIEASHVYVVVLSYRMGAELNTASYGALLADLKSLGRPATVVACITDPVDFQVLASLAENSLVRIIPLLQSGRGKRDAMDHALAVLASENVPPGAVVALMDGDTVIGGDTFARTIPVLLGHPLCGGVTTSNIPLVDGTSVAREWYRLRMRDRHQLMCSMSISRCLLVLTGRFSLLRACLQLLWAWFGHEHSC